MNKSEKEIAAIYISSCLDDMRKADKYGDAEAKEKATNDLKAYNQKLKDMLCMKFEMFGLDYEKSVTRPIQEVNKIAMVFYSQRVNGQQLKYPA